MNRRTLLFAASILCVSQTVRADAGAYLGVGAGVGQLTACNNATGTCNNFTVDSQNTVNPHLIGGFDINPYLGVEAGWSRLGSYKVRDAQGVTTVGSVAVSALTLGLKGGYKFHTGWSVFGKFGLAEIWTQYTPGPGWALAINNSQKSTGYLFAIGGGYDFDERFGLQLTSEAVGYNDAGYHSSIGMAVVTTVFRL